MENKNNIQNLYCLQKLFKLFLYPRANSLQVFSPKLQQLETETWATNVLNNILGLRENIWVLGISASMRSPLKRAEENTASLELHNPAIIFYINCPFFAELQLFLLTNHNKWWRRLRSTAMWSIWQWSN